MTRRRNRTPWCIPAHDAHRQRLEPPATRDALKIRLRRTLEPAHPVINRDTEPVDHVPPALKRMAVGPPAQPILQNLIRGTGQAVSEIEIAK